MKPAELDTPSLILDRTVLARNAAFANHVGLTTAMYDTYRVIEGGVEIVAACPRIDGR
jgi:D-serine deaminase-like pyridoxal phosphate-dependent protein